MLNRLLRLMYEPDGEPAGTGDTTPQAEPKLPKFGSQISPEVREKYKKELGEYADKSLTDVWSEHMETRGRLARAIVLPDPNGDPEQFEKDKKEFLSRMGIPETPDGYELKYDDKLIDAAFIKTYRENALKRGLTKTQAQSGLAEYEDLAKQGQEAIKQARTAAEQNLEPALKKAFNGDQKQADAAMNLAKKHLMRYGDKDVLQAMADGGLMFRPKFIMQAAEIERLLSDEKFIDGKGPDKSTMGGDKKGAFGKNYSKDFQTLHGGKK